MTREPVIVGVGIMTAIGLSAPETAAAVRAVTSRFEQSRMFDRETEPFTLASVPDDGLPPLVDALDQVAGLRCREIRLLRLATRPIADCLALMPPGQSAPGLMLALTEFPSARPFDAANLLGRLWTQTGGRFDVNRSLAGDVGRTGGLLAIARAAEAIRAGHVNFMIAGGVDTYHDPYVLSALDLEKRVKSPRHLDGFIPGEGAAFVLIANPAAAAAAGLTPLATISPVAHAVESGHLYSEQPYRGDGLASTLAQLFDGRVVNRPIVEVWSSMNGESHWAKEWGVAFLRNRAAFQEDHGMHHPADCYGDIGASCGPAMVALQAIGMRGSYRNAPALVYCSSDRGPRAALVVGSPE